MHTYMLNKCKAESVNTARELAQNAVVLLGMENLLQTEEEGDSNMPYLNWSLNLSLEMWRIEEMVLEMVLEMKEQL